MNYLLNDNITCDEKCDLGREFMFS